MTVYDHRSIKAAQERLAETRRQTARKSKAHKIGRFVGQAILAAGHLAVYAAAVVYLVGAL